MFGNPGSTELPMLRRLPRRLQLRARAPGGGRRRHGRRLRPGERRARRWSTCTPRPGVGNAMGAIFNAQANHSPLVITAGQQVAVADHDAGQPDQPRRDPDAAPAGQVELRAGAGRGRAARARARDAPGDAAAEGPDLRLDPDGRLGRRGRRGGRERGDRAHGRPAAPAATRRRSPISPAASRRRRTRCWSPAPTSTPAAPGTRRSRSPSASACRCSRSRRPAAGGSASPRATRTSAASCRRRSARSRRRSPGAT